ncbi:hypothetical protein GUJ93_ZPchr0069g33268 [Zizania palustris]|uniref:Uncharacterized protein n=1 Tax=Zizania palustris TaxID=103762 RepID=A0A8J5RFM6_ZIZPA|nr:hypothetical protein GUJ93_ZPchr0069g33268 [Zizania palustris]
MGVMSRRVLPACSSLCCFFPSLRARSRQPVKRYKKIIAEIYQLTPDGEPNDRRIGKLCDYVSRNPTRIPKITEYLEQRCYKELRHENFTLAKVVPCIYRKLLCSCKDHTPLLATSTLSIVRALLDQRLNDDLRVLGCLMLVDFLNSQVDSTHMFNLEGLIPKLCQIGQELREDDKGLRLRCAALRALASMVQYMGDHSHISMELDEVVSVIISYYEVNQTLSIKEVVRLQDDDDLVINGGLTVLPISGQNSATMTSDTMSASENPAHWARVCLHNMANIAKEATTVRRVLDPLFRLFDSHDYWSPENGIALSVLQEMQMLMDKSGQNGHLLLSFTIKHIDHKSVAKKPAKQINILKVASLLAKHAKLKASVTIASATSDLIKHLRKCMHCAIEAPNVQDDVDKWNSALYVALEECLVQLTEKVGDVGLILDMVGVMLENLSYTATAARTTISSVYRTVQIAASIHKSLHNQKAFPEALFHQLLLAMMHPDKKTRVGSHRVLSTIIAPSLLCPWSAISFPIPVKGNDSQSIILLALSAFSSKTIMGEVTKYKEEPGGSPRLNSYHLTSFKDENLKFMKLNNNQVSSHATLVRCFQLAFSLRRMSLNQENVLQPSRRRCLYTMASAMLIFSAKVGDIPQTIPLMKAEIPEKMVDPHLCLIDDCRLIVTSSQSSNSGMVYGSEEDESDAQAFLSAVNKDDTQLKEIVMSHFKEKFENLPEKFNGIEEQLLQEFSLDDSFPLGAPLFMETPHSCLTYAEKDEQCFDEEVIPYVLNVNQLIESVHEAARQVANVPVSAKHVPYDQMKSQCEALVTQKQQKMSVLLTFKHSTTNSHGSTGENGLETNESTTQPEPELQLTRKECMRRNNSASSDSRSFRLPPASPYDKFMKAAGRQIGAMPPSIPDTY